MKVSIRPIEIEDAEVSWRLRSNPKLVWEFMKCDPPLPASLCKEIQFISNVLNDEMTKMFAILADDLFVGWCSLKNIANGAAELSYCIMNIEMRGKGIGTEAVRKVVDYGFCSLGLDLIYRYVDKRNIPSVKMTQGQKFAPVGISYLNENVERFEMTKTGWMNQKAKRKE